MGLPLFANELRHGYRKDGILTASDAAIIVSWVSTPKCISNKLSYPYTLSRSSIGSHSRQILGPQALPRDRNTRRQWRHWSHRPCHSSVPEPRCMYRPSTDLQRLLDVIDCAIDGDIRQFSAGFGQSFEPSPREPAWDVFHLRFDYQPGVIGMQNSGTNILGVYQQGTRQVLRLVR